MNADQLAELEEERRFLLASIRDLDRERAVGDVDEHDYTVLRDGYIARAAAVLHEIEDGRSRLPARTSRRPWWRRALVPVVTIAVGLGLGLMVASYAGQRLPGQTITGGQTPDAVASLLTSARQSLNSGDLSTAASRYGDVLAIEPQNPEALTYSAWLVVLTGAQTSDQEAVRQGTEALVVASKVDDTYVDPVCLLAVARARFLQPVDNDGAREAGTACLAGDPPADMVPLIQEMLASLG